MRPVHPVHTDIAGGFGSNLPRALIAIPQTLLLIVLFQPELSLRPLEVAVFVVSIVGAYLLRAISFCVVGAVGFWTTRVDAPARVYMAAELLLSGRLGPDRAVPVLVVDDRELAPVPVHVRVPDRVLTTPMSDAALWTGLGRQIGWLVAMSALLAATWRFAIRRFDAVGI